MIISLHSFYYCWIANDDSFNELKYIDLKAIKEIVCLLH